MQEEFEYEYRDFKLRCRPQIDNGRFIPFMIISRLSDPSTVERATTLESPAFTSQDEAARFSYSAAMRWIDEKLDFKLTARPPSNYRKVPSLDAGRQQFFLR
jgi:hypothetical protein